MVMAGQEEEEEEAAGVGSEPDLEPTLEHDPYPEPELKPAWTFDGKGLMRSAGDRTREGPESSGAAAESRQDTRTATPPGC